MTAEELVRTTIIENICEPNFSLGDNLEELGADSLDKVKMTMDIETALGVDIPDKEIDYIKTVRDLVNLVKRYGEGKLS